MYKLFHRPRGKTEWVRRGLFVKAENAKKAARDFVREEKGEAAIIDTRDDTPIYHVKEGDV